MNFLQNKILHSRLEALHIQRAEKERNSAGILSTSTADTISDAGLQNVINYLRHSKEIVNILIYASVLSLFYLPLHFWLLNIHFLFNRQQQKSHC